MKKQLFAILVATALSGCEESVETHVYGSIDQCVYATGDRKLCEDTWKASQESNALHAPRFSRLADCIEQFGEDMCQSDKDKESGESSFYPAMMGFMMGQALSGNTNTTHVVHQPVYQTAKERETHGAIGSAYRGRLVTNQGKSLPVGKSMQPANVNKVVRGGFASRDNFSSGKASDGKQPQKPQTKSNNNPTYKAPTPSRGGFGGGRGGAVS